MKRNANANAVLIYEFTAVYCTNTNTADTKAQHTNTLTEKKTFQKFLQFGTSIE